MHVESMDFGTMVAKFQRYYGGKYQAEHLELLMQDFGDRPPEYLGSIYAVVVRHYSTKWGKLPDIAVITENIGTIREVYNDAISAPSLPPPAYEISEEEREEVSAMMKDFRAKFEKLVQGKHFGQ